MAHLELSTEFAFMTAFLWHAPTKDTTLQFRVTSILALGAGSW